MALLENPSFAHSLAPPRLWTRIRPLARPPHRRPPRLPTCPAVTVNWGAGRRTLAAFSVGGGTASGRAARAVLRRCRVGGGDADDVGDGGNGDSDGVDGGNSSNGSVGFSSVIAHDSGM